MDELKNKEIFSQNLRSLSENVLERMLLAQIEDKMDVEMFQQFAKKVIEQAGQ